MRANCMFSAVGGATPYVMTCTEVREKGQVKATITVDMTNATSDLTYTAVDYGYEGNDITVTHVDPSGANKSLDVTVSGTDITVHLATGAGSAISSTAALVKAAVNADPEASLLVLCEDEGAGTGIVNAAAKATLAGGVYHGCPLYNSTMDRCNFGTSLAIAAPRGASTEHDEH